MTALQVFANFASTTLAVPALSTDLSLTVTNANQIPTLLAGQYCYAVLGNPQTGPWEEVCIIGPYTSGTTTLPLGPSPIAGGTGRGMDGTIAQAWSAGATIQIAPVAQAMADITAQFASPAAGRGAEMVGYEGSATGEVAQTVKQKLVQRKSIWDFMTPAQIADAQLLNPVLDLSAPLAAAAAWLALNFSTSHTNELPMLRLVFPAGIYQYSVSPNWAFNDVEIVNEGKVIFRYTGTGDACILDAAAAPQNGHGVFGMIFGRFIIEALNTAGCGCRVALVCHSKISVMVKGCGNSATGSNLSTTGGMASFSGSQMTLNTVPTGGSGGLPVTGGYLPVGSVISASGVAAGTVTTGIISGSSCGVGTIYSLSTTPGTLSNRAFTSSAAAGIVALGCVCTTFDNPSVSNNDGFYGWYSTPAPAIGMFLGFSAVAVGPSACNIINNPIMEGLTGIGIHINSASVTHILGGTCEAIAGLGVLIDYGSNGNIIDGLDLEINTSWDVWCGGSSNSLKNLSATGTGGNSGILFQNLATANVVTGGTINKVMFQAGSSINVLDAVRVNYQGGGVGAWLTDQTGGGGGQNYIGKVIDVTSGAIGIPYAKLSWGTPNTITNNAKNPLLIYLNTSITGMTTYDPSGSAYTAPVSAHMLLQPGAKLGLSGTTTVYGHYI